MQKPQKEKCSVTRRNQTSNRSEFSKKPYAIHIMFVSTDRGDSKKVTIAYK